MKLLVPLIGAYLIYAGFFFLAQRRLLYPGAHLTLGGAAGPPPGVERVWLETSVGRVEAWYLPATGARIGPALLFAHGNGELIDHWPDAMAQFAQRGLPVLLVEYPGYGRSEGRPTQRSITEAFERGYDWLSAREAGDTHGIAAMGRSLGGGAVTSLAERRDISALVLMSTFSSVGRIAMRSYGLPGFLALDPYDNRAVLASFRGKVLIMHGRRDRQIPVEHAEALARAAPGAEVAIVDCGHNDCPPSWPAFVNRVVRFLTQSEESRP